MTLEEIQSKQKLASLNDAAFGRVMRENPSIYIATARSAEWRVTRRKKGSLTGLASFGELEVLLTDGICAWFRRADGLCVHGHIASFVWTEPEVVTGFYRDPKTGKSKFFRSERVGGSPGPLFPSLREERPPKEGGETPSGPRKNGRSSAFSLAMELLK